MLVSGFQMLISTAFGFSSDGSTLTRSYDNVSVLTNTSIAVTATFTSSGTDALRGFYYVDQLPSGMVVTTVSVTVNGQPTIAYTVEAGQDGDVYPGYTPWRWILEYPPDFSESVPVPPQGVVRIVYTITSSISGSFTLRDFSWVGYHPSSAAAVFGHSEAADQQVVSFVQTTASRLDVDRKIRDFKAGAVSQQQVEDVVKTYMQN